MDEQVYYYKYGGYGFFIDKDKDTKEFSIMVMLENDTVIAKTKLLELVIPICKAFAEEQL